MNADDLARILSNVIGDPPQIYLAIYDPILAEAVGGPWESVMVHEKRLVVLVKRRTTSEQVLNLIAEFLKFLRRFLPGRRGVKGEVGFP